MGILELNHLLWSHNSDTSALIILSQVAILPHTPAIKLRSLHLLSESLEHIAEATLPSLQLLWYHCMTFTNDLSVDAVGELLASALVVESNIKSAFGRGVINVSYELPVHRDVLDEGNCVREVVLTCRELKE
jgi:hypothetical protein